MNTILITGANRGLGLEMTKQYLTAGWQVIACCRYPDSAEKLQQLQGNIQILPLNVCDPASISQLKIILKDQAIDILMNNAGIWGGKQQVFGNITVDPWLETLQVNTIAPLLLAQALMTQVAASQLKIIANLSSLMGSIADNSSGSFYIYRSSKAALNAVTKSLAIDLKPQGIKVVALHPGWVKTDMGGPDAPLLPPESIAGLRDVLSTLSDEDSGAFLAYNGQHLSW